MISYFTDGSASPNPGPGGFAVIRNGVPFIVGSEPENSVVSRNLTTNIRMEGLAILAALDDFTNSLNKDETCELTTDSEFWINVLTKWAPIWVESGWQKKGGVKNLDIVKPLFTKWLDAEKLGAKLVWTRGHIGTELNELADEWANRARKLKVVGSQKVADLEL
jgi:ribonuclease HI